MPVVINLNRALLCACAARSKSTFQLSPCLDSSTAAAARSDPRVRPSPFLSFRGSLLSAHSAMDI